MDININQLLFQEHTPKINIYMAYAFAIAVVSGATYANYLTIFSFVDYGLVTAATFLFLVPFQWATGGTIASYGYLGHTIVGIFWALSFSLINDTADVFYEYLHPFSADYIMGLGIYSILSLGQFMLVNKWGKNRLWAALFAVVDTILFIPVFMQAAYLYLLRKSLTFEEVALIHRDFSSCELVRACSTTELALISALFIGSIAIFYACNVQMEKRVAIDSGIRFKWPILILLLAMVIPFILYSAPFQLTHGNTMTPALIQSLL